MVLRRPILSGRMFSNYKSVPIIALTANAVSGAEEMFIREGMNDIVAKPIETKVILSKLKKVAARR